MEVEAGHIVSLVRTKTETKAGSWLALFFFFLFSFSFRPKAMGGGLTASG